MDVINVQGMEDVTHRDISFSEFIHDYSGFLYRTEVEGILVGLTQEKNSEKQYRVFVICDKKELYSNYYPDNWKTAYAAYKNEVKFVRTFFVQGGRKEIFYFKDKNQKVVAVVSA